MPPIQPHQKPTDAADPVPSRNSDPHFDATAYSLAKRELQVTGFQFLLSLHRFSGSEVVIDLACGDGAGTARDLKSLVPQGRVYGVDISPGMINSARALGTLGVEFLVGDIEKLTQIEGLPIGPESIDVFVSNYGMHWILGRERMRAFLDMAITALKPGGVLLSLFAEDRIFPGFFERMQEVCARERWASHFEGGAYKHHPLPEIESFGQDVRNAGFDTEILELRQGWIAFKNQEALVKGVLGWLPQYMNRLPAEQREDFAIEVVGHYMKSTSSIPGYPKYQAGEIGMYDVSLVLKARKPAE